MEGQRRSRAETFQHEEDERDSSETENCDVPQRNTVVWYKRWVVCYRHGQTPDVFAGRAERRVLIEAHTAKSCHPHKRRLYLDHHIAPKVFAFYFVDAEGVRGCFQDPDTGKCVKALPKRGAVAMGAVAYPLSDSFVFAIKGEYRTGHYRVQHVASGLYLGTIAHAGSVALTDFYLSLEFSQ